MIYNYRHEQFVTNDDTVIVKRVYDYTMEAINNLLWLNLTHSLLVYHTGATQYVIIFYE